MLVTDAMGIHSGANPVSGEFSVGISGILIEGGFVSSRVEGAQIANAAHRQKLAQAIADGVADYARLLRAK